MTSDVGSSHLLEFAFWALWVTAVLRNTLSKDPKINWQRARETSAMTSDVGDNHPLESLYGPCG